LIINAQVVMGSIERYLIKVDTIIP
jgi:hypothetical protein